MKTVHTAVNKFYAILKQSGALSCPVYKYTKPTTLNPIEYVVINTLPVSGGVLQTLRVNVNFFKKDLADGVPDIARIEVQSTFIMGFLEQVNDNNLGIYIDFETQQIIQDQETGYHYSNFRFIVKLLNK